MPEFKFSDLYVEKEKTDGAIALQIPFFIRALGLAFIILLLTGFQAVFGEQAITTTLEDQPARIPIVDTGSFEYTVQEGDTVRSIAKMSGSEIEAILKLNDLKPRSILRAGQKLLLPYEPPLYRLDAFPVSVPASERGKLGGLQ